MNEAQPSPFSPRVVLALLLFGALAFVLTLYLIGIGENGRGTNDGGGHVGGKGLNGYAALADLMERRGWDVVRSRSEGGLEVEGLLVLTPPQGNDGAELEEAVAQRRYAGPTIVILPKWSTTDVSALASDARRGWVVLDNTQPPGWEGFYDELTVAQGKAQGWQGAGTAGQLPAPKAVQSGGGSPRLVPLVTSNKGEVLAGFIAGQGNYPALYGLAGLDEPSGEKDEHIHPLVFVFEPDLLNNYGLARKENAVLADRLFDATASDGDSALVFDMSFNGLGRSVNLLTLAFTPPFLATTLCLAIAAIAVAWRALRRFGPPLAEARKIAFGKRQLIQNSAGLIRRTGRLHLVGAPYAAIIRARIAKALGLRRGRSDAETEAAIDSRLAGLDRAKLDRAKLDLAGLDIEPLSFIASAERLRAARSPQDMLRAAQALKRIERMLET